jgi:hypothetical protein
MSDESESKKKSKMPEVAVGTMFLYQQPEYLNRDAHEGLGWTMPSNPYAFAQDVISVPLVLSEIPSAQKFYPIVFSGTDNAQPLAVFSIGPGRNLFVGNDGVWEEGFYIPAYLRRYPFATAAGDSERVAVVIDRASSGIVENSELPFFDGDKISQSTQSMIDLSVRYEADRKSTQDFMGMLSSLDLLKEQHLSQPSGGESVALANFISIDGSKVEKLPAEELEKLNKKGYLPLIYAQLFSQENWGKLITRMSSKETE